MSLLDPASVHLLRVVHHEIKKFVWFCGDDSDDEYKVTMGEEMLTTMSPTADPGEFPCKRPSACRGGSGGDFSPNLMHLLFQATSDRHMDYELSMTACVFQNSVKVGFP
jgi:hypothetical protein